MRSICALMLVLSMGCGEIWGKWFEVGQTPYDDSIRSAVGKSGIGGGGQGKIDVAGLSRLMQPIRRMPHRKCDEWQAPEATRKRGKGDCKAKAVLLLAEMKKAHDASATLVIGRRSGGGLHCWLEWNQDGKQWVLDPSFYSTPVPVGRAKYAGEYSYKGGRKYYNLDDKLLASR